MQRILTYLFFLIAFSSSAQNCEITVSSKKVCIGNTTLFGVKFDAGLTVSSYSWNFGNSATSTQATPVYQYPQRGTFTPSVTVVFTNSQSCTINGPEIKVLDLPKADFVTTTKDTQCFDGNQVCIEDRSSVGLDNAPLSTRVILFGDGNSNITPPGTPNPICHSYSIPLGGAYDLVLEVVDTNGCLSRKEMKEGVLVWPKLQEVSFRTVYTTQCNGTPVQFINTSKIPQGQVRNYIWNFGDFTTATSPWTNFSHTYTGNGKFNAKLTVFDRNGCKGEFELTPAGENFIVDSLIYLDKVSSCYRNNNFTISSQNGPPASVFWSIYRIGDTMRYDTAANITALSMNFITCGQYRVKMYVNMGVCKTVTDTLIDVLGPKSVIEDFTDPIRNSSQCEIHDTVFFRTPVKDYSCFYNNPNINRLWDFDDGFAEPCTTDTKNGINVGRNCNYSKDSINVKHAYKPGEEKCYFPKLILTDMASGCTDTSTAALKLTYPDAGWDSLSNPIRRGLYYTGIACLDNPIKFWFDQTLPKCGRQKLWMNFDSACGWQNFVQLDSSFSTYEFTYNSTCNPDGWVTVGIIIQNGTDKNGNPCIDTAWYHNMFRLFPVNPQFLITRLNSGCGPWSIKLSMVDSIQDSIKRVTINFNNQQTITLNLGPNENTIPSQYFTFTTPGLKRVTVSLVTTRNCTRSSQQTLGFGYTGYFTPQKEIVCLADTFKPEALVWDFGPGGAVYWTEAPRLQKNKEKYYWDFGDGKGFTNEGYSPDYVYKQIGNYTVRLVMEDSLGCRDTFSYKTKIKVVDLQAAIKPMLPRYLCAPQILAFQDRSLILDSSAINNAAPYDTLVAWQWDFGENKNSIFLQNPVYDYTSNGNFTARLIVRSSKGCLDTASIPMFIDGPAPSFTMSDTLGCSPFKVNFTNTTGKQLINWIWFFRDPQNTSFSTQRDTAVSFTYTTPGIYKVYLLGEDTLFDPIAGIMKTCRSVFPDSLNPAAPRRQLRVLPSVKAELIGLDTICKDEEFELVARYNGVIPGYKWNLGDGTLLNRIWPDSQVVHRYSDTGVFLVTMMPQVTGGQCVDSSMKYIKVTGVKADFDFDESKAPSYQFNNLSKGAVRYVWDFGQPRAGQNNRSTEENPFHTYLADTGIFTICLWAFNEQECVDSICKETQPKVWIYIPNVFTPNGDGINDAFDIDMQGGRLYDLKIYNRWGNVVFEGKQDGIGNDGVNWNGTNRNKGEDCPTGVYYFVFKYRLSNMDAPKEVHSSVTLLREE
ncbi:MAG: PKD domain-containing protein [Bacteroidia bacterium]|nr:PKD domain-containing protein [Bacteroidia bacterium]